MKHPRTLRLAVAAGLFGLAACADAALVGAGQVQRIPRKRCPYKTSGPATVSLRTTDLQPVAQGFAFGVNRASFRNGRLSMAGDLLNLSAVTYGRIRLLVTAEHGARRHVVVTTLGPGHSRRVQVRLPTGCNHAPSVVGVRFLRATAQYASMPRGHDRSGFEKRGARLVRRPHGERSR